MNARFYRLIYNRTRALLMAVAEISRSYSGAGAASTVKAASLVNKSFDGRLKAVTLKPLTFRTYLALGLATISLPSLLFTPSAFASTIIADSSHKEQPMVINSANGTTQVNIVTPNKHGLSHNRYSQFDVSGQGVILNNSGKNSKTQLAGYIEGNQALMQSGGAKIILNEVNSSRPSELNGYIEVAGQKAQVIIANSAGITCSGCGFINAGRSTLTTGKPVINEGQLTGYQVTNGTINVEGKGFDASRSDYTDLIARAVQINSAIWANEANVITGQNEVSLDTKTVTPLDISSTNQTDNSNNNSNITDRPEFAIDVAALGGMYAGKIRMIGTEKGVGVRSAGELGASAGSITLSADGKIINLGAMQANTAINLNSRGDIQNEKQLYSHGDIALSSQKDIKNSGSVVAGQNITLISGDAGNGNSNGNSDGANSYGTITSSKGSTLAAGVDDKGRLTKAGSISAHADNITLHGSNLATKSIDLKSQNALDLQGSEVQTGSLTANASKMALQNASINAKEDINLTADTINHKAATLLGSNLHITADSLSGDGKLLAGQNITLNLKEAFTNQSDIIANGNINVNHESSLTNAGRLLAGESLTLKALASSKRTLATITNKGEMESENITVLGNTLTNYGVINGGAVKLTLTGDFLNLGAARFYGDDILINAVNVKNHGDSLDTKEAPTVAARQKMVINSQTVDNDNHALLLSLGDISIVADTVNNHSATIESQGDMVIIADTINNINDRFITEIAEIDKVDEIKEYSPFGSADRYRPDEVKIEVSKKKNHREWIMTTSDGRYSGYKFYEYNYDKTTYQTLIKETNPANIMAGGNLTIKAKTVNNENSKILAGQNLLLTVTNLNNYSAAGINRVEDIGTVTYHYRKKKKHGMGTKPDTYHHKTSTSAYQNITETTIDVGNGEIKEHAITPSSSLNDKARDKVNIINNVATIESDIKLPNSAIYSVNKDVDKNYLIESDPKFTNHHKWLSSDYMFDRMRLDPNNIQKRLGDGYYEQQLIKEQVVTLTGQRYLGGYQSDMEQYQALMNAGATFADMYNLTVGVALTKEQMESLTTDIVWFVSKTVEVDGQMEEVLVPQLYVVNRPKVSATGALIAGSNTVIQGDGNINTTGAINSKNQLVIAGDNITNGGIISGGRLQMASQGSIINHGTILGSDGVNLSAKNDIILESKTKTTTTNYEQNSSSNTAIDRPSQVITTNGDITITAGHDINLAAGQVINQSDKNSSGKITLTAGNDIKLDSVEVSSKQEIHTSKNNYRKSDIKEQVGSTIQGNGNIAINAANDIKVTGSDISSEQNLNLTAGNNIDINSSKEETHLTDHSKVTSSGFLSSETSISHIEVDNETQKGSYLTGENVTLNAGNSMSVIGSDIIADSALNLTAGGDINIDAAKEIYHHYEQNITKKSGLMSSGGLGVTYGSESSDLKQTDNEEAYRGSTVGSLTGSVNISSGKNLTINGSDVIAKEDIKLQGENVAITAQDAKTTYDENYTYKKSGLTVALTGTASDLYEAGKAVKESKKRGNDKLTALQGIKAALTGAGAALDSQTQNEKGESQASIGVSVMVGSQKTERTVKEEHHSAKGSTVSAGRDVTITATGNANNANNNTDNSNNTNTNNSNTGNITLTGSEIKAGSDVNLTAANNLNVTAALNTQHSDRKETSKGGNVGIGLSFGGDESGFRFKGDANFSRERERQDGSAWSEGVITAGNTLNANIQNDANLTGAILNGNTVNLNVGGNLNLTSLQDSDDYDYDKISASINGSAGFGGASGNLAFDSTQMTSHWQSVTEQTGIFAGSGGYNITVNNNTNLTGAVIASEATDSSKNTLNTGTLTFSDIKNSANYKVDHVSLSVGTSNSSPTAGAPAIYHKEESSKNITHSAISDGTINIHDKENQTQDINELSHDTANAHHTLKPIFDKDKELEKIEIIDSIRDIANQAKDLAHKYDKLQAQKAVDKNGVPQKFKDEAAAALSQNGNKPTEAEINQLAYNNAVNDHIINQSQNNLGTMGGSVDKGITAAASIATGIITGNIAGGLAGASAPYLATVIKENTYEKDKNGNIVYENGQPKVDKQANLIAHAILGAAVAAAQNSSAIAGGLGAAGGEIAADTIRDLLYDGKPNDKLTESEKENISALTQLALGIATATATGGDMDATGAAVQAGKNSVENNLLSPTETSKLERLKSKLQSANTVEEREQIQSEIDYINQIDKETDAFIADVCQTGSKTSDACQAAHKIVADLKAQYDAEYSGYPASNPLLVKELFYNKEAAAKVDAAFANSAAGAWMYTLEQYMQTNNVSFDEAYQVHKTLIDINMAAEMASYLIMTKTAADLATKYGSKYNSTNKTPSPATAEDLLNKGDKIGHTLDDKLVNNILNTEKGARPDPSTYMSQAEIDAHLALFDDGAVRFTSKAKYEQYGTYGSKDSFVMPKSEFENIMIQSKGDLRIVEQKLGLEKGYLSNSDTIAVYIKKENFGKLNVPSGNEDGANKYWKPGGVTSGGIPEATLDFSKKPKVDIIDLETIKKQLSGNKK